MQARGARRTTCRRQGRRQYRDECISIVAANMKGGAGRNPRRRKGSLRTHSLQSECLEDVVSKTSLTPHEQRA